MTFLGLSLFGMTLFAALVALLQWQRERARNRERVNRGLREFVAVASNEPLTETMLQQG